MNFLLFIIDNIRREKTNMADSFFFSNDLRETVINYGDKKKRRKIIEKYGKIERWDVSNIKDFSLVFKNIIFDEKDKNFSIYLNLNGWNMENSENISHVFEGSNFNGYLGKWNTINVILAIETFKNSSYKGIEDTINNWDVRKLEETTGMFECSFLSCSLEEWKLEKVRFMEKMFFCCFGLIGDYNKWNKYIKSEKVSMVDSLYGTRFEEYDKRPYWYLPGAWEREIIRYV